MKIIVVASAILKVFDINGEVQRKYRTHIFLESSKLGLDCCSWFPPGVRREEDNWVLEPQDEGGELLVHVHNLWCKGQITQEEAEFMFTPPKCWVATFTDSILRWAVSGEWSTSSG